MLHSTDPCVTATGKKRPVFVAWLGNFFEPYFSDKSAVQRGLADLRELGMNSIVLDSKLWSDFTTYFRGGPESQYVGMQNYIREVARENGLGVSFLALFAIGDNLYPEIYEHPPEYVEQPVDYWGKVFRGYRHWSEAQLAEHVRHVLDLYKHIARDAAATAADDAGNERLPFYFYHSPIFAPSFDEEGRQFYLGWLRERYTLTELNARYGTDFASIDSLDPTEYWVHPDAEDESQRYIPWAVDYQANSAVLLKHADNQRFKHWVMREYFTKLLARLREQEPRFYFYAGLSQWKFFFNDFIHIQNRGWDLWDMGGLFDSPTFITMPVDNHGEVAPYVVPCELSMLRSAARDQDFVAALFIGRYLFNDLYAVCSPAEILASTLGAGGTDLYFYGYNGLDDGGNFEKWHVEQKKSLKDGLDWFTAVREVAGKREKTGEAAMLFPFASYHLSAEPTDKARYQAFRDDYIGWYQQLSDHGVNPDTLHPAQVKAGALAQYRVLVVPADPLYNSMRDEALEAALREFVAGGGVLLHGLSELVENAFGLERQPHKSDAFLWEEKIVTPSHEFASYPSGEVQATYISSGRPAYSIREHGAGSLHSFGLYYGQAYGCKEHLPVSREYKMDNHYPLTVAARTPVDKILADLGIGRGRRRGIEIIPFTNGDLYINHTPYTLEVPRTEAGYISSFEGFNGTHLPGRHAAFVLQEKAGDS